MRATLILFAMAAALPAQAPDFDLTGSVRDLMIDIIYPTSDALFYIERSPPKTEVEWNAIRNQALMLAESGNLLLLPGRARDQAKWVKDTRMMIESARAAYKAALAKNMAGILAESDRLTEACVTCHREYRPNFRK